MKELKIILADDHTLVRAGIRSLIQQFQGMKVVGEAGDGNEALRLVKELKPDILLTDIAMPGMNGLDTVARLKRDFPGTHVVILSMHVSEEYVLQALKSGADGYLLKDSATTELEQAVKAVSRGEKFLSPSVSQHVIEDYKRRVGGETNPLDQLSSRQREILKMIAEGKNTKEIAQILELSAKTVETHRAQLMDKLDIHDIPGLVRYAIKTKLVTLES